MRVPFEPTAFPGAGRTYLAYELYPTNFTNASLAPQRVEVLGADGAEYISRLWRLKVNRSMRFCSQSGVKQPGALALISRWQEAASSCLCGWPSSPERAFLRN
jgi:hypothetical protein